MLYCLDCGVCLIVVKYSCDSGGMVTNHYQELLYSIELLSRGLGGHMAPTAERCFPPISAERNAETATKAALSPTRIYPNGAVSLDEGSRCVGELGDSTGTEVCAMLFCEVTWPQVPPGPDNATACTSTFTTIPMCTSGQSEDKKHLLHSVLVS